MDPDSPDTKTACATVALPSAHDVRRIAVEARCGEKSVRAFYRGEKLKPLTQLRIRDAVAKLALPCPTI